MAAFASNDTGTYTTDWCSFRWVSPRDDTEVNEKNPSPFTKKKLNYSLRGKEIDFIMKEYRKEIKKDHRKFLSCLTGNWRQEQWKRK